METRSTTEGPKVQACLAARDLSAFSLLVEDLHDELGESWGELDFDETNDFLCDPSAGDMKVLIVAVDEDDREQLEQIETVIAQARRIGLPALLVAEDLTDLEIYQLTQCGATPVLEYPLQEGDLAVALVGLCPDLSKPLVEKAAQGQMFAIQGITGGAGSSTLAVNLARELAALGTGSVCLLDLDVQFGSVGLELGLPSSDAALDLLFDPKIIDADWMHGTLQAFGPSMHVLTAPEDLVPLDTISPHGLIRLLALAKSEFDYVVIDMPKIISEWTHAAFDWADTVFCPVQTGKKSNALVNRFRQTCLGEGLELHKVQFIANRVDGKTPVAHAAALDKLSRAAGKDVAMALPDGGANIGSITSFAPLSAIDPENALGAEIQKLAHRLASVQPMVA